MGVICTELTPSVRVPCISGLLIVFLQCRHVTFLIKQPLIWPSLVKSIISPIWPTCLFSSSQEPDDCPLFLRSLQLRNDSAGSRRWGDVDIKHFSSSSLTLRTDKLEASLLNMNLPLKRETLQICHKFLEVLNIHIYKDLNIDRQVAPSMEWFWYIKIYQYFSRAVYIGLGILTVGKDKYSWTPCTN